MDGNAQIMADLAQSTLSTFGFGFMAGSLFAILVLLILDWIKARKEGYE